jgi:hypothetical protein
MIPASAMECNCDQCGAEFYIGRTSPKRFDDYLWPGYCPVCGASKSLRGSQSLANSSKLMPRALSILRMHALFAAGP